MRDLDDPTLTARWVDIVLRRLRPGDHEARTALALLELDSMRYRALIAESLGAPAPGAGDPTRDVTDRPHTLPAATPTTESK